MGTTAQGALFLGLTLRGGGVADGEAGSGIAAALALPPGVTSASAQSAAAEEAPAAQTQARFEVTPRDAIVELDNVNLGAATAATIEPGKHTLRVSQDGFVPKQLEFSALEGKTTIIRIRLREEETPSAAAVPKAQAFAFGKAKTKAKAAAAAEADDQESAIVTVDTPSAPSVRAKDVEVEITSEPTPPAAPAAPALSPTPAQPVVVALAPTRKTRTGKTPRVADGTSGDSRQGRNLIQSRCAGCHGVAANKFSAAQWRSFFADGRHDRFKRLGGKVSAKELGSIKSYLEKNAADAPKNQGAGIR
ncbi:MAG: PEGA domain-containing protein [Polyangiaceae bacterium]